MTIPPIPRYVMSQSAVLIKRTVDAWGGISEEKRTDIHHIRLEPQKIMKFSMGGDIPEVKAKMFIDSFNTEPPDVDICVGDIILHDGIEYAVSDVQSFYDISELHHREVLLT